MLSLLGKTEVKTSAFSLERHTWVTPHCGLMPSEVCFSVLGIRCSHNEKEQSNPVGPAAFELLLLYIYFALKGYRLIPC